MLFKYFYELTETHEEIKENLSLLQNMELIDIYLKLFFELSTFNIFIIKLDFIFISIEYLINTFTFIKLLLKMKSNYYNLL